MDYIKKSISWIILHCFEFSFFITLNTVAKPGLTWSRYLKNNYVFKFRIKIGMIFDVADATPGNSVKT